MKRLLGIPLLCSLAFGQGAVIGPNGAVGPKGVVSSGVTLGGITVAKVLTDSGGSLSSPYTIAVSSSVPAGSWLVVFMSTRSAVDTAGVLKDSQGNCSNAYTEKTGGASWFNSSVGALLWQCHITTPLTVSDHLTYTPTTDSSFTWQGIAIANLTTGFDNAPTPTSNTSGATTETVPTYTPGIAHELVCYAIATQNGTLPTVTYNNLIGSAPTLTDSTGLTNGSFGSLGCRVISSATAGNGSITLSSTSNAWMGTIWGYD